MGARIVSDLKEDLLMNPDIIRIAASDEAVGVLGLIVYRRKSKAAA